MIDKQKQQIRAHMLNQRVYQLLESGLWGTLYDDLVACYRSVGLTIPKGFTLSCSNNEETGELARQINDKRIQVKYDPKAAEGKLVLKAVFNGR